MNGSRCVCAWYAWCVCACLCVAPRDSPSRSMYPPPHMPCILLLICHSILCTSRFAFEERRKVIRGDPCFFFHWFFLCVTV